MPRNEFGRWRRDALTLTIITSLLFAAACEAEGQAQENQPAVTQTIEGLEDLNSNGEVVLEEGVESTVAATQELAETLQEALLVQFENIDDLSAEELEALEDNTAEFIALVEEGIERNPDLKEKIFTATGPIVAFDPARLIYHNGMWAYFAPEGLPGDPLANSLLMTSTAEGSEGELRVCSLDGAASVLGVDFPSGSHFLDFDMIDGNNACVVRDQNNIIQAITDTTGQWSLPQNTAYSGLDSRASSLVSGVSALDSAKNGNNGEEKETPTPPAPEAPEFPSDLVINEDLRFDREYPMTEYEDGYKTKQWRIIIRKQDLHLDEPFTLKDGRFHVQAWADAWFMDKEGKGYHLSIPLMIYDTERSHAAGYFNGIWKMDSGVEGAKEVITKFFTGPFNENLYFKNFDLENSDWCLTETQVRNCGEGNLNPILMETGYIPSADIDMTSRKWDPIRIYLEFHRELLADIYTQENVEAFWQDPDFSPRSLQFADPNVPANFFIPLAMPITVNPYYK